LELGGKRLCGAKISRSETKEEGGCDMTRFVRKVKLRFIVKKS
jgi:hypothetical protein